MGQTGCHLWPLDPFNDWRELSILSFMLRSICLALAVSLASQPVTLALSVICDATDNATASMSNQSFSMFTSSALSLPSFVSLHNRSRNAVVNHLGAFCAAVRRP